MRKIRKHTQSSSENTFLMGHIQALDDLTENSGRGSSLFSLSLDPVADRVLYSQQKAPQEKGRWRSVPGEAGESQPALTWLRVEFSSKPGQTSTQEARLPAQISKGNRTLVSPTWWKSTPKYNTLHPPLCLLPVKCKVLTCIASTSQNLRTDFSCIYLFSSLSQS